MNSYLLDIIPTTRRAEYISIINGFNGLVYIMYSFLVIPNIIMFSSFFVQSIKTPSQKFPEKTDVETVETAE